VSTHLQGPLWSSIVDRIRSADPAGMEELYARFEKDVRSWVWRHLGPQQIDDRVYDILLVITRGIESGNLREPEQVMLWVKELARRQAAELADQGIQLKVDTIADLVDLRPDQEGQAIENQKPDEALRTLRRLPPRDQEVLRRFCLKKQSAEEICRALQLSEAQFQVIKSHAVARFKEIWRREPHDHPRSQKPGDSAVDCGPGETLKQSSNPTPSPHPAVSHQDATSGTPSGPILTHAAETFGTAEKADHWLNRPNHVFQSRTPLEMLAIDPQSVEIELSRIDYGVYI
jgi:DNA-directed RNA polymerase specialized sigma24 family protein